MFSIATFDLYTILKLMRKCGSKIRSELKVFLGKKNYFKRTKGTIKKRYNYLQYFVLFRVGNRNQHD